MNLAQKVTGTFLREDIALLDEHGCQDNTMALMAAEHAARTETLCKALQCPALGRALLLSMARGLLDAANQIADATVQQPELVNV